MPQISKEYLDDTPYDEHLFGGKLITGRRGFLAGKENYTLLQNMRYSSGGIGLEGRYGMRRFNNSAVASGGDIEKLWQHIYSFEHSEVYDLYAVSDEKALYKADSIPEASAGSGSLGSSLYSFTSGCNVPSFCSVENHAICNTGKEIVAYSGATPYPAAFLYGTDIGTADTAADEDDKTFAIQTDEVTNDETNRTATITLDTQANNEALYIGFWQPIDAIAWTFTTANINGGTSTLEYWNGSAWTALSITDGTSQNLDDLESDTFSSGSVLDTSIWNFEDGDDNAGEQEVADGVFKHTSSTGSYWQNENDPSIAYQTVSGDFTIRVKLTNIGDIDADYEEAGVAIYLSDGNHAKCVYTKNSGVHANPIILTGDTVSNTTTYGSDAVGAQTTVYFELSRSGSDFTYKYNFTGIGDSYTTATRGGGTLLTSSATVRVCLLSGHNNGVQFTCHWDDFTVDDTSTTATTLSQDGSITWTAPAAFTEKPRRINGQTLFWYRHQVSAATSAMEIQKLTVLKDWRDLEDLSDGWDVLPTGFIWMDDGDDPYVDMLDRVLVDQRGTYAKFTDATGDQDLAAGDEFYVGFPIRVLGFKIYIVDDYHNDGNASAMTVSYWNGSSWTAYAADEFNDGTSKNSKSLNQTGEIRLEDKGTSVLPSTLASGGLKLPMFWYKISFDAKSYNDTNDEMRIWKIRGIPAPKTQYEISKYKWIVDFKDRLFLFGPKTGPNLADFSAYKMPFALSGQDTSSVWPRVTFGYGGEITTAVRFFNECIVFKVNEVWMMEGDSPDTFGTLLLDDTLGCPAPHTAKLVRTWVTLPDGRQDFRHAVFFLSHDGLYGVDGLKCWKVSADIDSYLNPSEKWSSTRIKDGYRDKSYAWFDPIQNEFHLLVWCGSTPTLYEFVYNTEVQKWAGPFERLTAIESGITAYTSDEEIAQYGGGTDGRVYRLEYGSNDVYTNGTAGAINCAIECGDHWDGLLSKFAFRGLFLFGKAQSAGNVTVELKGEGATTVTSLGTVSMINSGKSTFLTRLHIGEFDTNGAEMENKFHSARMRFRTNTAGVRPELYGWLVKKKDVSEAMP